MQRILIVGGGFAGAAVARGLKSVSGTGDSPRVALVDRSEEYPFIPLIHEVAVGRVNPGSITSSLPRLVRSCGGEFIRAEVTNIDLERRAVQTDSGPLEYTYLVLAPGSASVGPPKALADHLQTFGTLPEALALRDGLSTGWRRATRGSDADPGLTNVVIVGGGTTGVELAFELASLYDYLKGSRRQRSPGTRAPGKNGGRIVLVEATDRLMGWLDPYFHEVAVRRLAEVGVELHLNTAVEEAGPDGVMVGEEWVPAHHRIWTAGVTVPELAARLPGEHDELGRVRVDEFANLPDHPEVYLLGDTAAYTDSRHGDLPPTASVAVQQGPWAAADIKARLRGGRREPFRYWNRGYVVSAGPESAIAEVTGRKFEGASAQALYRSIFLYYMGRRERALTGSDWATERALGRLGFAKP